MSLPFSGNVPQGYYEMALNEASRLLSPTGTELVSIKVRPLHKWPIQSDSEFSNGYVYPDEYKEVYKFLSASNLQEMREGHVSRGRAKVFSSDGVNEFLFVEHETGPEIIVYLGLAAASVSLATSIVQLVTEVIKWVNTKNEEKKKGEAVQRYYEVEAISIEERRKNGSRIVKVIKLPLSQATASVDEIMKLL